MTWLLDTLWHWFYNRPKAALCGSTPRSSQWPAARRAWLKDHPRCVATGSLEDVEVHHKVPFHDSPELELDPANFVTVRRDVHFLICHSDNWKSFNPDVDEDLEHLRLRIANRP